MRVNRSHTDRFHAIPPSCSLSFVLFLFLVLCHSPSPPFLPRLSSLSICANMRIWGKASTRQEDAAAPGKEGGKSPLPDAIRDASTDNSKSASPSPSEIDGISCAEETAGISAGTAACV